MKRNILKLFTAACICTIGFTSCQKAQKPAIIVESTNEDVNRNNLMSRAKEFNGYTLSDMRTYSIPMQRQIFGEMNSENQAMIWQQRIDEAINLSIENKDDEAVTESFKVLRSMIGNDVYAANNEAKGKIDEWVEQNVKLIGYERLKVLVTTLGGNTNPPELAGPGGGGGTTAPLPGCDCNGSDDWCGGTNTPTGKCSRLKSCPGSSAGCGLLWLRKCNGSCVDVYVATF